MVAGNTATRKNKARKHQQDIATAIQTALHLPEEDVVSRPMGHRASFGLYCWLDGRTVFGGEKIPEWCPLEDAE